LNAATLSRLLFEKRGRSAANSKYRRGHHRHLKSASRHGVSKNTDATEFFRTLQSAEQRNLLSNMILK
jgi:hypothetical protein